MWGNAMSAKVNLALINTTRFDSGALGMMAMVIHAFTEAGSHRGSVLHAGIVVGDLNVIVDEKSDVMQLDIDLAAIAKQVRPGEQNCDCHSDTAQVSARVVSPKGHVLFYASSGSGYAVRLEHILGKVNFDSTQLQKGDLFALSLLEPAQYKASNTLTKAQFDITVEMPDGSVKDLKAHFNKIETTKVIVDGGGFKPAKLHVISTQGVVFQINEKARIVIEKKAGGGDIRRPIGPKASWRKFVATPVRTAKM
jgi:hypothetical protein